MLSELINIHRGDVVSIVGCGGKTSLLFYLGNELRKNYSVLLTTSAKIFRPLNSQCDIIYNTVSDFLEETKIRIPGLIAVGKSLIGQNKFSGIEQTDLDLLKPYFDFVLIEADGSKGLPLKGWKEHEPPVLPGTTITIGILPASVFNLKIDQGFIYGFDEFVAIVGSSEKFVTPDIIARLIFHPKGMFKNASGKRVFIINQVETEEQMEAARKVAVKIKEYGQREKWLPKILIGSILKGIWHEY